jgi:hypothetical protein
MNASRGRTGRVLFAALPAFLVLLAVLAPIGPSMAAADEAGMQARTTVYRVLPSATDPSIRRFDDPHIVAFNPVVPAERAALLVFLPGTGGSPHVLPWFAGRIAAGYRVVSLAYDNGIAIQQVCPRQPDADCAAKVRGKRIYGEDTTPLIDDAPAEAIMNRLVKLLRYLEREHPADGWGRYLRGDEPDWNRITLSGQSQGAGMAAFIAKRSIVRRVVLLSSPWDSYGPARTLAPWIAEKAVTEPARWYGCFHAKEAAAGLLAASYERLRIPQDHVRVLTVEIPVTTGLNPYHGVCVSGANPEENFSFLFGSGIDTAAK